MTKRNIYKHCQRRNKPAWSLFLAVVLLISFSGCGTTPVRKPGILSVSFVGAETYWLVQDEGKLLKVDAGIQQPHGLANQSGISAVAFYGDRSGWVITQDGTIYSTTDQGENWVNFGILLENRGQLVTKFEFTDNENGFLLLSGDLFITNNGGREWNKAFSAATYNVVPVDFYVVSSKAIWVASHKEVFSSLDGGKSWNRNTLPVGTEARSIYVTDDMHIYVGTWLGSGIYLSKDGGITWIPPQVDGLASGFGIRSITVSSDGTLWASGLIFSRKADADARPTNIVVHLKYDNVWEPLELTSSSAIFEKIVYAGADSVWMIAGKELLQASVQRSEVVRRFPA